MISSIDELRSGERGMTLIEMLVSLTVGLIVLGASFTLLDRAVSVSHQIGDRQEAVQRGRLAMELMTRQLRSQVCLGESAEPITYGDDYGVTFYADLSDGSSEVERRTLSYDAAGSGRIVEQIEPGDGVYPDLDFETLPSTSKTLLTGVELAHEDEDTVPVFRYFAFQPGSPTGDLDLLSTPLNAVDASRTVMVRIAFATLPERPRPSDSDATTLQDDVYVRIADPARPQEGPRCI